MSAQDEVRVKPLRFKNPPIVEAIIAFQIMPLPESAIGDFSSGVQAMSDHGYRQPEPVTKHEVQIKFEGPSSTFGGIGSQHGLRFNSEDGLHAVQFNRDGFVFSRLGKYRSWELFREECKKPWDIYLAVSGVRDIVSYGVRYINKLRLPLMQNFEEYINIYPHLPDGIPKMIHGCFMRLELAVSAPAGQLVHQQILLPPEEPEFSPLILDNDFRFPALGLTANEIWEQLDQVRLVKDHYFDVFTTPKMKETFNV
jgi:uncharacterized protein (TIGR04255 family)